MREIQDAIDGFRKHRDSAYVLHIDNNSCNLAVSALEQQLNNGWIPVNDDTLPENKVTVIVTRITGSVGMGFCNRSSNTWRDSEGYPMSEPLAWMYKPERYTEVAK